MGTRKLNFEYEIIHTAKCSITMKVTVRETLFCTVQFDPPLTKAATKNQIPLDVLVITAQRLAVEAVSRATGISVSKLYVSSMGYFGALVGAEEGNSFKVPKAI